MSDDVFEKYGKPWILRVTDAVKPGNITARTVLPMNELTPKKENLILTIVTLIFIAWSVIFIYRTSFIAIDGNRYFCLFDDAMISMRYAWNLSHGNGLVWNAGENVQGYTILLMSFVTLVFDKSFAGLFIQILGVGFMLTIAFASMKIADQVAYIGLERSHISQSEKALIFSVNPTGILRIYLPIFRGNLLS